jgi:hypothetical protein
MEHGKFVEALRVFLEAQNVNMGRKSTKREQMIATVLQMVGEHLQCKDPVEAKAIFLTPDRVKIEMGQNSIATKGGKAAVMTEAESSRTDEKLGRSPL